MHPACPPLSLPHIGKDVTLDALALLHPTAQLHGKVHVADGASIWPYVVMRSEMAEIRIGARTNLQDFVMVHVGSNTPTIVGEDCSITHHVTLHGCEIGDRCLIGINATVMDGARIGENSIVAGHARGRRPWCGAEDEANRRNALFYLAIAGALARGEERIAPERARAIYEQGIDPGPNP